MGFILGRDSEELKWGNWEGGKTNSWLHNRAGGYHSGQAGFSPAEIASRSKAEDTWDFLPRGIEGVLPTGCHTPLVQGCSHLVNSRALAVLCMRRMAGNTGQRARGTQCHRVLLGHLCVPLVAAATATAKR